MSQSSEINEDIRGHLAADRTDAASDLLDQALAKWPKNARLLLTKADILARKFGAPVAAEHLAGLLDRPNLAPWAARRLEALLGSGRLSGEDAIRIGNLVKNVVPETQAKLLNLLFERCEPGDRLEFLKQVGPTSGLFTLEWKLAVARTESGEFDAALDLLQRAHADGRSSQWSLILEAELLAAQSRLDDAIVKLRDFILAHPDHVRGFRRLITFYRRAARFDDAIDILQTALERWPRDWSLLFLLNRTAVAPARLRAIFELVSDTGTDAADDRYRLQFAIACLHAGEVERARSILAKDFESPVSHMARPLSVALGASTAGKWRDRSRLMDDRTRDVQVVRHPDARATIVVMTGIALGFGYLPLALIDGLFASFPVNLVYLRDFNARAYLRGIASMGSEAETLQKLTAMIRDLAAPRTIVLGASLGGFGALRYGALLGADVAVSFSGPTSLASQYESTKPSVWNPRYFGRHAWGLETDIPKDLLPVLSAAKETRFIHYVGAEARDDLRQAERVRGLARTEVIEVPGVDDHYTQNYLIGDGSFECLIARLIDSGRD